MSALGQICLGRPSVFVICREAKSNPVFRFVSCGCLVP